MWFACLALTLGFALAAQADVAVGDPGPAFALSGSDGKVHSLTDSVGKRAVVVAWFPKAFTPG
jgi:peroxiredoxin Q/BCP